MHTQGNHDFGTNSQFGTLTGWIAQDASISTTNQLARVLDTDGNGLANGQQLFDEKTEVTQNFTAGSTSADLPSLYIGGKHGDNIVTSITINTTWNDFAKISLTGHQHTENPHGNTLAKADIGGAGFPDGLNAFGATDFMDIEEGDAILQSSSMTITCQHVDHNEPDGDHAIGENYDCVVTVTETFHGEPDDDGNSEWKITNKSFNESNTDFVTYTITAQKPVTLTIPSSNSNSNS